MQNIIEPSFGFSWEENRRIYGKGQLNLGEINTDDEIKRFLKLEEFSNYSQETYPFQTSTKSSARIPNVGPIVELNLFELSE